MGLPMRMPTAIAWVVVALMVAWAPLFHVICIAPAESASATHVMADGTVMTAAVSTDDADHGGHGGHAAGVVDQIATVAAAQDAPTSAGPATALLDAAGVIGVVVVFAGMAALTIAVFVRRCRVLPSRGDPPRRRSTAPPRRSIRDRLSTDVDLHRLGILRT